ncbi:hypothetical protein WJX74_009170 [Apatococcus lobatus]|uniref:Large ribosomal subunit protein uL6 alpha-beta domain-containing protein n=1 Tax=Apatococcus lobatus TaxID=904363 RepID=A0AAW1RSU5_9CHLO
MSFAIDDHLRPRRAALAEPRGHLSPVLVVECGSKGSALNKESRIGKKLIEIPQGVKYTLDGLNFSVKGPKGELKRTFPGGVKIEEEEGKLRVYRLETNKKAHAIHGLVRSLASNMIEGCHVGFSRSMELRGVGYRAAVSGRDLTLNLGLSHPVIIPIPQGIDAKVERNIKLTISGFDKELVGQFCATIRAKRPPEPYKGKGIRYEGEVIKQKEGKKGRK